jgi:hypothetical protein
MISPRIHPSVRQQRVGRLPGSQDLAYTLLKGFSPWVRIALEDEGEWDVSLECIILLILDSREFHLGVISLKEWGDWDVSLDSGPCWSFIKKTLTLHSSLWKTEGSGMSPWILDLAGPWLKSLSPWNHLSGRRRRVDVSLEFRTLMILD